MKKLLSNIVLTASLSLLTALQAQATLITSNTLEDAKAINFDEFESNKLYSPFQTLDIGMSVSESIHVISESTYFTNLHSYSQAHNGYWRDGMTFIGNGSGALIFKFVDGPVSSVGAFLNYARWSGLEHSMLISVMDEFDQELETYDIVAHADIITPGEINGGGFRGIQRQQNDIWSFMIDTSSQKVLDNFTFSRAIPTVSVPEPGMVIIFALSLLWIVRKKASV